MTSIRKLKALDSLQAQLLSETFGIHTLNDLLYFFPHRYEDKTFAHNVSSLRDKMHPIQLIGRIAGIEVFFYKGKRRLKAIFRDKTGQIELLWIHGVMNVRKLINENHTYLIFGRPTRKGGGFQIIHPTVKKWICGMELEEGIFPIYPSTKALSAAGVDNARMVQVQKEAWSLVKREVEEVLPDQIIQRYNLLPRKEALQYVHFAPAKRALSRARRRLKFEELFWLQLESLQKKARRRADTKGYSFKETALMKRYHENHLSFALTKDQKQAIREVYRDMKGGEQMNRLLQGDVGSGKTVVAFMSALLPISSEAQVALAAPTEVLATQHYDKLKPDAERLGFPAALLKGSTPSKDRASILRQLEEGSIKMIVGTHALFEDKVKFNHLGLAIIDEQHRFGVAQRAKIWTKNGEGYAPHVLVMTATPIPRTLAMTLYGDLDVSTLREKPRERMPIVTYHRYDKHRLVVFEKIRQQIAQGHQAYIVYPRVLAATGEEVYKDVMDGYESVCRAFPSVPIGMLHGRMHSSDKAYEMNRFVKGETKIMVGTTILEVGISVSNATVMVIENADMFGLAQLHQLRGRVGRGKAQSYCFLVTQERVSQKAKQRVRAMMQIEDGFQIAEMDLKSRGPGDVLGVQQSGMHRLKLADLGKDHAIMAQAQSAAKEIVARDPLLHESMHRGLKKTLEERSKGVDWSTIS